MDSGPAGTVDASDGKHALSIELGDDVLHVVMSKSTTVSALKKAKFVCGAWRQSARDTLCDVDWLASNGVSLHSLLKTGAPSARLVTALIDAKPELLRERDAEGLLPLQFAAAYRTDRHSRPRWSEEVVSAIRKATIGAVPGGVAGLHHEARSLKLRPVRTRVTQAPIAV